MYRALAVILVTLPLATAPALAQRTAADSATGTLQTSATATRSAPADLAVLTVDIADTGATPAAAGARVAAHTSAVRSALEKLGIPRDSLPSRSQWGWWQGRVERALKEPRYVYPPPGTVGPTVTVRDTIFIAHDGIQIRTHDIRRLGAVIDALLAAGLTTISPIQFSATGADSIRLLVLQDAAVKVRTQAEAIARAAGVRLGATIDLNTDGNTWGPAVLSMRDAVQYRDGLPVAATDVVEPAIPISATVHGSWRLNPAP